MTPLRLQKSCSTSQEQNWSVGSPCVAQRMLYFLPSLAKSPWSPSALGCRVWRWQGLGLVWVALAAWGWLSPLHGGLGLCDTICANSVTAVVIVAWQTSAWGVQEAGGGQWAQAILPWVPGEGCGGFLRKYMKINLSRLRAEEEEIPSIDSEYHISLGTDLKKVMPWYNNPSCCWALKRSALGARGALEGWE